MRGIGIQSPIMTDKDVTKAEKSERLNLNDCDNWVGVVKPEIPQCAIDVIEEAKKQGYSLFKAMNINDKSEEFCNWIESAENQESFACAWIVGYEETYYLVKMKNLNAVFCYLAYHIHDKYWSLASNGTDEVAIFHTRKELDAAGFSEVFTSSLFEVEKVRSGLKK